MQFILGNGCLTNTGQLYFPEKNVGDSPEKEMKLGVEGRHVWKLAYVHGSTVSVSLYLAFDRLSAVDHMVLNLSRNLCQLIVEFTIY